VVDSDRDRKPCSITLRNLFVSKYQEMKCEIGGLEAMPALLPAGKPAGRDLSRLDRDRSTSPDEIVGIRSR
jgi:hypothetical protein